LEDLQALRRRVDEIDVQILKAVKERVAICRKIGEQKKQQDLPIRDQIREQEVFSKVKDIAVEFKLEPTRIEALYREIVNMCSDIQK
jgi:chorismate mutase